MSHEKDQKLLLNKHVIPEITVNGTSDILCFKISPTLADACHSEIVKAETLTFIKQALSEKLSYESGENIQTDMVSNTTNTPRLVTFNLPPALSAAVKNGKITEETIAPLAKMFEAAIIRDMPVDLIEKTAYDFVLAPLFASAIYTQSLANDAFLKQVLESAEQAQKFDML